MYVPPACTEAVSCRLDGVVLKFSPRQKIFTLLAETPRSVACCSIEQPTIAAMMMMAVRRAGQPSSRVMALCFRQAAASRHLNHRQLPLQLFSSGSSKSGGGGKRGGKSQSSPPPPLDFAFLELNASEVRDNILQRRSTADVDLVLKLHNRRKELSQEVIAVQTQRNALAVEVRN